MIGKFNNRNAEVPTNDPLNCLIDESFSKWKEYHPIKENGLVKMQCQHVQFLTTPTKYSAQKADVKSIAHAAGHMGRRKEEKDVSSRAGVKSSMNDITLVRALITN